MNLKFKFILSIIAILITITQGVNSAPVLSVTTSSDHNSVIFNVTQLAGQNNVTLGTGCYMSTGSTPTTGSGTGSGSFLNFTYTKSALVSQCGFNITLDQSVLYGLIYVYNTTVPSKIILLYKANITITKDLLESIASSGTVTISTLVLNNVQVADTLSGTLNLCNSVTPIGPLSITIQSSVCLQHTIVGSFNVNDTIESIVITLNSAAHTVLSTLGSFDITNNLQASQSIDYWIDFTTVTCSSGCYLLSVVQLAPPTESQSYGRRLLSAQSYMINVRINLFLYTAVTVLCIRYKYVN